MNNLILVPDILLNGEPSACRPCWQWISGAAAALRTFHTYRVLSQTSQDDWRSGSMQKNEKVPIMGQLVLCYRIVPIRTPHVWCLQLPHTREGTSIWITACEATTRCICVLFGTLLMKVIRYTTDYGGMYTEDVDHGSVVCHPVDETVPHHQSPFRYVHATKCQPYFGQKENWVFSTNELMTHN